MIDLTDKSICLTGGTGSLGNALTARILASANPRRLIILSRDELKQSEMMQRTATFPNANKLRFLLGDVRDRDRLYRAFDGVDLIIHMAALKQVPAGEYNPSETIRTNVIGAMNVIDAAIDRGVSRVIALSTDKATNPTNLYGASKLCAEKLFVAAKSYVGTHHTTFACVRYGNVALSRGSVIPIWRQHVYDCDRSAFYCTPEHDCDCDYYCHVQDPPAPRRCSGLTLTDPRMTRFWITLDQAVTFVLACLDRMHGGEIFIPKLPSVRMTDVAQAVAPDCKVTITGIRPGEKLHEALIGPDEPYWDNDDHFIIHPEGACHGDYTSANNPHWLSVEEIRAALA